jgi:acetyl esterase/lipase
MPLDPAIVPIIEQLMAGGLPPLNEMSVPDAREAALALAPLQGEPQPVARVEDRRVPGPAGEIPVRLYAPPGAGPWPLLVYFHGGGWVIGDVPSYDALCRRLALAVPAIVVSVEYRRAPEDKFPAAAEDSYAAACALAEGAAALGADPQRVAVGGDSAGGNLSAVVSLMARDRGGPRLAHQLLVYPVTDATFDTPSYRDNAEGYLLTRPLMEWFWGHYLASPADGTNPYASPLRAGDLAGLPPATVITAEFDPLRDEGEAYAARLRAAGVPVRLSRYDGMIHGFFAMPAILPQAHAAIDEAAAALRAAFGAR